MRRIQLKARNEFNRHKMNTLYSLFWYSLFSAPGVWILKWWRLGQRQRQRLFMCCQVSGIPILQIISYYYNLQRKTKFSTWIQMSSIPFTNIQQWIMALALESKYILFEDWTFVLYEMKYNLVWGKISSNGTK